jgi:hypothetical protein
MFGFAEEVGLVGGNGVDEVLALRLVLRSEEAIYILIHRRQPEAVDAAQEPALDHHRLAFGHFDADFRGDELRQPRETGSRQFALLLQRVANSA